MEERVKVFLQADMWHGGNHLSSEPGQLFVSRISGVINAAECPRVGSDILVGGKLGRVIQAYVFEDSAAKSLGDKPPQAPVWCFDIGLT